MELEQHGEEGTKEIVDNLTTSKTHFSGEELRILGLDAYYRPPVVGEQRVKKKLDFAFLR